MRRRIANLFAAALGLMSLGLVVLSVRSFWVGEYIRQARDHPASFTSDDRIVGSGLGYLLIDYTRVWRTGQEFEYYVRRSMPPDGPANQWRFRRGKIRFVDWGYRWDWILPRITHILVSPSSGSGDNWRIQIPYWIPILLTGTWPVLRLTRPIRRHRRQIRRRLRHQCVACGYDLRAHTPGEKCPECGRQMAAAGTK